MLKLSKDAAQIVFNEISIPRGPSDRISAVIQMCLKAGAEVPGSESVVEPVVSREPEPRPARRDAKRPVDNASGEGAVTNDAY